MTTQQMVYKDGFMQVAGEEAQREYEISEANKPNGRYAYYKNLREEDKKFFRPIVNLNHFKGIKIPASYDFDQRQGDTIYLNPRYSREQYNRILRHFNKMA